MKVHFLPGGSISYDLPLWLRNYIIRRQDRVYSYSTRDLIFDDIDLHLEPINIKLKNSKDHHNPCIADNDRIEINYIDLDFYKRKFKFDYSRYDQCLHCEKYIADMLKNMMNKLFVKWQSDLFETLQEKCLRVIMDNKKRIDETKLNYYAPSIKEIYGTDII